MYLQIWLQKYRFSSEAHLWGLSQCNKILFILLRDRHQIWRELNAFRVHLRQCMMPQPRLANVLWTLSMLTEVSMEPLWPQLPVGYALASSDLHPWGQVEHFGVARPARMMPWNSLLSMITINVCARPRKAGPRPEKPVWSKMRSTRYRPGRLHKFLTIALLTLIRRGCSRQP